MSTVFIIKIESETPRNSTAVACRKRYPRKQVHKDRRTKRQNKKSWQKEIW